MELSSDVTTLMALFAIVSPITSIPVFLNLTKGATKEKRRIIAVQTALVSGLIPSFTYGCSLDDQGLTVLTRIFGLLSLSIAVSTIMSAISASFPRFVG